MYLQFGPFECASTSFDGFPQEPRFYKTPKQKTYAEEMAQQAANAKIHLELVAGKKIDTRNNTGFLDKESLAVEDVNFSSWEFIKHLPKLNSVGVSLTGRHKVSQGFFDALETCPALESLNINGDVSNVDVSCLNGHPFLKRISFGGEVSLKTLKEVAQIKGLKSLSFSNSKLPQEAIGVIGSIKTLHTLNAVGEFIKDFAVVDYSSWENLPNLENLRIVTPIRDSEADAISNLKHIRVLCISNAQNQNLVYKIAQIPTLFAAEIRSTRLSDRDIEVLKNSSIKHLHIGDEFNPGVFKRFAELTNIESLVVGTLKGPDASLLALEDLPHLNYLFVQGDESTAYSASLLSRAKPQLKISVYAGGLPGSGVDLTSYYAMLRADVLKKIGAGETLTDPEIEELIFLSEHVCCTYDYNLPPIREVVALALAKQGQLERALKIQQASHELLLEQYAKQHSGPSSLHFLPAMDLSNSVHAYILGKQKKFAMANKAFEISLDMPGIFVGQANFAAEIFDCYAEILKDEGRFDLARIQERKAIYLKENPPLGASTHSFDTRYWVTPNTPRQFW